MLKLTAYSSTPTVTFLFNPSSTSGCVPKENKCTRVSPFHKVAGTTDYTQIRPISLLLIISKNPGETCAGIPAELGFN